MSARELGQRFHTVIDVMMLNSMTQAIPQKWRRLLCVDERESCKKINDDTILIRGKTINIQNLKSRDIYWVLIKRLERYPTSMDRWISEFPFLNDHDFQTFFKLPYKIVRSTKM